MSQQLESILVVYQNPREGRLSAYDDWYTNVHIRDAMRLDGAIATQRFVVHALQPVLNGRRVVPFHWAHTIYEWESAQASVDGHNERAGTQLMEITKDCSFNGLRDFFFRPRLLSHGWSAENGFRKGDSVLTALLHPGDDEAGFVTWFEKVHAPAVTALPGIATAGLFSLHEAQSLPIPSDYPMVAIYGLTNVPAGLRCWEEQHDATGPEALVSRARRFEIGCWEKRIDRLKAVDVLDPTPDALAIENRTRSAYAGSYFTQDELGSTLAAITPVPPSWIGR